MNSIPIATFKIKYLKRDDGIDIDSFTEISKIDYLLCHIPLVDCNQSIISKNAFKIIEIIAINQITWHTSEKVILYTEFFIKLVYHVQKSLVCF